MMNYFLRCLLISLTGLALTSCSGKADPAPPQPYVTSAQSLEIEAARAYQLGNYQQALRLYDRAYAAYSAIDDQREMAQQSIHQAQIALLLKDLNKAERYLAQFEQLKIPDTNNPQLRDRYALLQANASIQQEDWVSAEDWMQAITHSNSDLEQATAVNQAIIAFEKNKDLEPANAIPLKELPPLSRARLERLLAAGSLHNGNVSNAASHIEAAKQIYRDNSFAPGIAESLWLESRILARQGNMADAENTKARAEAIFERLGITLPDL